jgi:uncharacterized protein DUF2066
MNKPRMGHQEMTPFDCKGLAKRGWQRAFLKPALLAVMLAATLIASPAFAATEDVYTVRMVPVDATADEAAEARVIAIRQGRALALRVLLQRLTLQVDWPVLPVLGTSEVTALGAGFEISNERNSPTRYLATITYRFKPTDVRAILQGKDIPFSEVQARRMVVLPVFLQGDKARVFQDDRDWSLAWANRNFEHELVSVITPLGDLGDVIAAPVEAAIDNDFAALSEFADRYGVQEILLAKVRQDDLNSPVTFEFVRLNAVEADIWTMVMPPVKNPEPDARPRDPILDDGLEMRELPIFGQEGSAEEGAEDLIDVQDAFTFDVPLENETVEVPGLKVDGQVAPEHTKLLHMMDTAINKGIERLQEDWKARTIIRFDAQGTMVVSARFEKISQWLVIKRAIQSTPNITDMRLVALSTDGAHMEWDVVGTPGQLALALSQHDVALEPGTDETPGPANEVNFSFGRDDDPFDEFGSAPSTETNDPWGDDQNPWASQEEETQDRVTEGDSVFDPNGVGLEGLDGLDGEGEDFVVPGTITGGFFLESDEGVGTELLNVNPDFWIVKFAPKVDPEVWPTDDGALDDEEAGEASVDEDGNVRESDLSGLEQQQDGSF